MNSQLIDIKDGGHKVNIEIPVANYVHINSHTAICRKADPALEPGDKCLKCEFGNGQVGGCEEEFEHVSFLCDAKERKDEKDVFFEKFVGSVE